MIFLNRIQAGEKLAEKIQRLPLAGPLVLAIPRGACPWELPRRGRSHALSTSFRSSGSPSRTSCGAVAMDGTSALNLPLIHRLEISAAELEMTSGMVREEAGQRERTYRNERPFPPLAEEPSYSWTTA